MTSKINGFSTLMRLGAVGTTLTTVCLLAPSAHASQYLSSSGQTSVSIHEVNPSLGGAYSTIIDGQL